MIYRLVNWALRQSKPKGASSSFFRCCAHSVLFRPGDGAQARPMELFATVINLVRSGPCLANFDLRICKVGLYRAVIRFISSRIIKRIILVSLVSGAVMFVANLVYGHLIPRSVPIIYSVLLFCALAGLRFDCAPSLM